MAEAQAQGAAHAALSKSQDVQGSAGKGKQKKSKNSKSSAEFSGSSSIISDHSFTFERKAGSILRATLWSMFRDDAFPPPDGPCEQYMGRILEHEGTRQEVDFCSTLHVHPGLEFREDPKHFQKIKMLNGTLEEWLGKLLQSISSSEIVEDQEFPLDEVTPNETSDAEPHSKSITPTKTSTVATHYVVCESKIRTSEKSLQDRVEQLERVVLKLCRRKGATNENAPSKAVKLVALAGLGVPLSAHFGVGEVAKEIAQQEKYPILNALYKEKRLFVLEVETLGNRIEGLETGIEALKAQVEAQQAAMMAAFKAQAQAQQAALKAQAEEQQAALKAQAEAQQAAMMAAFNAQITRLEDMFKPKA